MCPAACALPPASAAPVLSRRFFSLSLAAAYSFVLKSDGAKGARVPPQPPTCARGAEERAGGPGGRCWGCPGTRLPPAALQTTQQPRPEREQRPGGFVNERKPREKKEREIPREKEPSVAGAGAGLQLPLAPFPCPQRGGEAGGPGRVSAHAAGDAAGLGWGRSRAGRAGAVGAAPGRARDSTSARNQAYPSGGRREPGAGARGAAGMGAGAAAPGGAGPRAQRGGGDGRHKTTPCSV